MPLSKLSSNSFNTQANLTSLTVGTTTNRALGNAFVTSIATDQPGLVTIGKPYDGGATTIRFTSNPSGYGNNFYHSIGMGAGAGLNMYAGGYQSPVDNETYPSPGSNLLFAMTSSTTGISHILYTGTATAAAANTHISNKSYVRYLIPFEIAEYGQIRTPPSEYVQGVKTSWGTTALNTVATYQAFQCRAFVKFNGTTNVIVKAANFSSITDTGVSTYRVNFNNNLPDADYTVTTAAQPNNYAGAALGTGGPNAVGDSNTNTYVALECRNYQNNGNEPNELFVSVFR